MIHSEFFTCISYRNVPSGTAYGESEKFAIPDADRLSLESGKHFVDHSDRSGSNEYNENAGEDEKN